MRVGRDREGLAASVTVTVTRIWCVASGRIGRTTHDVRLTECEVVNVDPTRA